jgi:transglutaminase-like putative cysteine protease
VDLNPYKTAKALTYELTPKQGATLGFPSSDSQSVKVRSDGKVLLRVRPAAIPAGARFPYRGRNKAVVQALQPTRFIQSDDEGIRELAMNAIGNTRDAGMAVKRIEQFVGEYIDDKNISVGYASAVEVLKSRQGDCSEHAILTAALCRAVGIPAEVVVGIVYVDEFAGHAQVFGGHAWTRALVGDTWVDLDATDSAEGYGVGHIAEAYTDGNPESFFSLLDTIGQFRITSVTKGD